jgi:hypothetical protein
MPTSVVDAVPEEVVGLTVMLQLGDSCAAESLADVGKATAAERRP